MDEGLAATLTITHLNAEGDGSAMFEDKRIAVPFSLEGEEVHVNIRTGKSRGKKQIWVDTKEIVKASPQRVAPACPHFGEKANPPCGGCRLQHLESVAYTNWKKQNVEKLFAKAGVKYPALDVYTASPASRRRAVLSSYKRDGKVTLGFNERGRHRLVDITHCAVLRPRLVALLPSLRALLQELVDDRAKVDIHVTELGGRIEVVFLGIGFSRDGEEKVTAWAVAQNLDAVYSRKGGKGTHILYAPRPLQAHYGDFAVALPPACFLQASDAAERAMLETMTPHMEGAKHVLDLFCGSGLFALSFAHKAKLVRALDSFGPAIEALKHAARGSQKIVAEERNLFADPLKAADMKLFDTVIIDPPRAGASAQCAELAQSSVKKIIYVSCNPQSFAQDAFVLQAGGYAMQYAKIVDQFLWTAHVELVAVFERD